MTAWKETWERAHQRGQELQLEVPEHVLLVRLGERKMEWLRVLGGVPTFTASFFCTGSPRPPDNREGSLATPLGLFAVAERFGDGAPVGTVFVARKNTGETYQQRPDAGAEQKALVTTRILWLTGLEPGFNQGGEVDTYDRYIYIHGTNHPEKWPMPHSAGCLNLADDDLVALYAGTDAPTWVWIEA